jgi:predicted  nucleic acid-binding Zn-ribbon protein
MENMEYSNMSNAEIRLRLDSLSNEFESKKRKLSELCEEMDKIEREYLKAKSELEIRRTLYI